MSRWIVWAARLYPAPWRQRYGAEFAALLEDSHPGWRDFFDILRGALLMRLKFPTAGKIVAGFALAFLVIAVVVAVRTPDRYMSTAVLQFQGGAGSDALDRLNDAQQEILSRNSLSRLIQQMDLYQAERQKLPLEDIVRQMRNQAIAVRLVGQATDANVPPAFSISFEYTDRYKAREVTGQLAQLFAGQTAVRGSRTVIVLDDPALPQSPVAPRRSRIVIMGLGLGLTLGLIALGVRRWPLVAICGAAAGAVAFTATLFLPARYVSTAVPAAQNRDTAAHLVESLTDRAYLRSLVEKLNLYPRERTKEPINDVVENMLTHAIRIQALNGRQAVTISFMAEGSGSTAQAAVRELVAHAIEANVTTAIAGASPGGILKVLDPASRPEGAVSCVCQPDLAHFDTQIWPPCGTNNPSVPGLCCFRWRRPERSPAPPLLRRVWAKRRPGPPKTGDQKAGSGIRPSGLNSCLKPSDSVALIIPRDTSKAVGAGPFSSRYTTSANRCSNVVTGPRSGTTMYSWLRPIRNASANASSRLSLWKICSASSQ